MVLRTPIIQFPRARKQPPVDPIPVAIVPGHLTDEELDALT
jgi:hypothetical protein